MCDLLQQGGQQHLPAAILYNILPYWVWGNHLGNENFHGWFRGPLTAGDHLVVTDPIYKSGHVFVQQSSRVYFILQEMEAIAKLEGSVTGTITFSQVKPV